MKRILIILEDREHQQFKERCFKLRMPMSEVLRKSIEEFIKHGRKCWENIERIKEEVEKRPS